MNNDCADEEGTCHKLNSHKADYRDESLLWHTPGDSKTLLTAGLQISPIPRYLLYSDHCWHEQLSVFQRQIVVNVLSPGSLCCCYMCVCVCVCARAFSTVHPKRKDKHNDWHAQGEKTINTGPHSKFRTPSIHTKNEHYRELLSIILWKIHFLERLEKGKNENIPLTGLSKWLSCKSVDKPNYSVQ